MMHLSRANRLNVSFGQVAFCTFSAHLVTSRGDELSSESHLRFQKMP